MRGPYRFLSRPGVLMEWILAGVVLAVWLLFCYLVGALVRGGGRK